MSTTGTLNYTTSGGGAVSPAPRLTHEEATLMSFAILAWAVMVLASVIAGPTLGWSITWTTIGAPLGALVVTGARMAHRKWLA